MKSFRILILVAVLASLIGPLASSAQPAQTSETVAHGTPALPSPASYLGYPVGADFRLAPWDSIVGYLNRLAATSPAMRLDTLGVSTLGEPFVLATITAPENLARLEEIKAAQARLADPRRLREGELETLLDTQPAVVFIIHNLHSNEIASSQGGMELAYTLVSDSALAETLDDVVVLLVPSANPDGQRMVVDWYRRTLGTPYEGSGLPTLYHHYADHDNNRDWFMLNLVETRMITEQLYQEWFPEVVYDVHQMGNRGARFFVPPFDDPVNPNLDPLLVRTISLFGLKISTDLEAAGKPGVVNYQTFDLWWHGGARSVPTRHNMAGLLSETASARYASPIFQEADRLNRAPDFGVHYPNPWVGGWWRIRDILDYQLIAARSVIGFAAGIRRQLLRNYVQLGRKAVRAGMEQSPFAFVIPPDQRDPDSAARMLEILRLGGVEIHRADAPFRADGVDYDEGSWVVLMAQPYRSHAKDLLERQSYPDRRVYPGGPPDRPYDVSGWTLPLQMGVEAIPITGAFDAELQRLDSPITPPPGRVVGEGDAFALDYRSNAASLAIHQALRAGGSVALLSRPFSADRRTWPVGSVVIEAPGLRDSLAVLAQSHGLSFEAVSGSAAGFVIDSLRVGLYEPWSGNSDAGWTRFVFDRWGMPYRTLRDAEARAGNLEERYDVIVVPEMSRRFARQGRDEGTVPDEYAGGLGGEGFDALRSFVRGGGTLVLFGASSDIAIQDLGVPVRNVRPESDDQRIGEGFYAPGSVLRVVLTDGHPLAYGMPGETAVYYSNGPIFEVMPDAASVSVVGRYSSDSQLLSGYALNSDDIADRAALVEARVGAGRAVLFSFRPQHRAQSHETFKLLFNAIYRGAAGDGSDLEF